jgi:integrase
VAASSRATTFVFAGIVDGSLPWWPHRVTAAFERRHRELGIEGIWLHDLRHFTAIQMFFAGITVKTVADKLIHFDAATTLNVDANALETLDTDAALLLARILNYQEKS